MSVTMHVREYNPTTGRLVGNVSAINFGNVNIGEFSPVKVLDLVVQNASLISNVSIEIRNSTSVPVNASPVGIAADGSSSNGNFGVETSDSFVSRNTLSRFFAGEGQPVSVGTRNNNTSKFIYLNAKMAVSSPKSGTVTYRFYFDVS